MASQIVTEQKRYRISLLLDAYGDLLTDKQRNFMRLYYEGDLSFGEIAREHEVSRQAIFDSVRHGEDALERFESVLGLVAAGWIRWSASERLHPDRLADQLDTIRQRIDAQGDFSDKQWILEQMEQIADDLKGNPQDSRLQSTD